MSLINLIIISKTIIDLISTIIQMITGKKHTSDRIMIIIWSLTSDFRYNIIFDFLNSIISRYLQHVAIELDHWADTSQSNIQQKLYSFIYLKQHGKSVNPTMAQFFSLFFPPYQMKTRNFNYKAKTKAKNRLFGEIKRSRLPALHIFYAYLLNHTKVKQYSKLNTLN